MKTHVINPKSIGAHWRKADRGKFAALWVGGGRLLDKPGRQVLLDGQLMRELRPWLERR